MISNSILKYLSFVFKDFNKRRLKEYILYEILHEEGIEIEYLSAEEMAEEIKVALEELIKNNKLTKDHVNEAIERAKKFLGYICYGDPGDPFEKPLLILAKDKSEPIIYFTIGHELGHYFLHPFIASDMPKTEVSVKDQKILHGMMQSEADLFASMLLIPDSWIHEWFKEDIETTLIKGSREDVIKLKKRIYLRCESVCKSLLGIDLDKEMRPRAQKNLRNRVHQLVCEYEAQMIMQNGSFQIQLDTHIEWDKEYEKYWDLY